MIDLALKIDTDLNLIKIDLDVYGIDLHLDPESTWMNIQDGCDWPRSIQH
jgi:hypothetical protein